MSTDFVAHVTKMSNYSRRNVINGEDMARLFFTAVGDYAPSVEEVVAMFEALPEHVMAEFLRMLDIYYEAEYIVPPGIGGDNIGGENTTPQEVAMAKANHPRIKQACKMLKPKVQARLGLRASDNDSGSPAASDSKKPRSR